MLITTQAQPSADVNTARNRSEQAFNRPSNSNQVNSDKVCWIEVKRYPYQPDHQVELLHLQAEADALLIELQAIGQQQLSEKTVQYSSNV
ncbi:MAG: hypothetical protein WBD47_14010 [Phormidesmis sp.]